MRIEHTPVEGLLVIHLDVHPDNRGWFKENWQREKMVAAGLPDFHPVQNNVSFNATAGATRGLHAEPWDKLISITAGRAYCAWCDLRAGSPTYGQTFGLEVGPDTAVFVPRGVANGYQVLEDNTVYSYLVNAHWSPEATYSMTNLDLIDWPLPITEISAKDQAHPPLREATPLPPRRVLVTGANGQLGRALAHFVATSSNPAYQARFEFCERADFDITNPAHLHERDWNDYEAIINCAAYNDVNGAETDRATCWDVNALAPARLAAIATQHNLTLVHVSTDYVFGDEGTSPQHPESETPGPLSLYGASKAAGEAAAQVTPKHYVVRTSWVFGQGSNFMATMANLARNGISPRVINDQYGRPTWAHDLAAGILHLLDNSCEYGIYNLSSDGPIVSRAEIAHEVFVRVLARSASSQPDANQLDASQPHVIPVSTQEYRAELAAQHEANSGAQEAARPHHSSFDLSKIKATGFEPTDWREALEQYLH